MTTEREAVAKNSDRSISIPRGFLARPIQRLGGDDGEIPTKYLPDAIKFDDVEVRRSSGKGIRRVKSLIFLLALMACFYVIPDAHASVREVCKKELENSGEARQTVENCVITIFGAITKGDVKKVSDSKMSSFYGKESGSFTFFALDSMGGDVTSALEIGRVIRKRGATTIVRNGASCASACVFILASGIQKIAFGNVIVHRPYIAETGDFSADYIKRRQIEIKAEAERYLEEMNIPVDLYTLMFSVEPEDGYILSNDELGKYLLHGWDPVHTEQMAARKAKRLGLSRQRLMKLENNCRKFLPPESDIWRYGIPKEWSACQSDIESGQAR